MNIQKTVAAILFMLTLLQVTAQIPEAEEHDFIISGVPQYLVTNGIRIDLDIHKKNSPHWFILSPYYYIDQSSYDLLNLRGNDEYYDPYSYEKLFGVGLGIARKTYLPKKSVSEGFYLLYGMSYKFFDIDGNNFTWVEYTGEDGLIYQEMQDLKYNLYIHSLDANACVGYQKQVIPSLYIDIFIGFGIKYGIHSSPENVTVKYNRGIHDFGYTGTHIVGGLRLGYGF